MIVWTVFAQPCGRANKVYPEKVDCSSLKIDTFSLLKKSISVLVYYVYVCLTLLCVCMSHFAHVKVRGQLVGVRSFLPSAVWILWIGLSRLVTCAFTH